MKVRLTLRPGQRGTHALVEKYAERLLAVRYRYCEQSCRRFKTVELIEQVDSWMPGLPKNADPDQPVLVRIAVDEYRLREQARRSGGRWRPAERAWSLSLQAVYDLGLSGHVIKE